MNKTKNEILFSYPQGESEPYGRIPTNRIYEAMDMYSEQEIKEYTEWLFDEKGGIAEVNKQNSIQLDTDQLYNAYLQYKTKQNERL